MKQIKQEPSSVMQMLLQEKQKNRQLKQEIQILSMKVQQLNQLTKSPDEVQQALKEVIEENTKNLKNNELLAKSVADLHPKLTFLNMKLEEEKAKVGKLQQQNYKLQRDNYKFKGDIIKLVNMNDKLKHQINNDQTNNNNHPKFAMLQKKLDQETAKVVNLKQEICKLKGNIMQLVRTRNELTQKLNNNQSNNNQTNNNNDQRYSDLMKKLKLVESVSHQRLKDKNEQIRFLRKELKETRKLNTIFNEQLNQKENLMNENNEPRKSRRIAALQGKKRGIEAYDHVFSKLQCYGGNNQWECQSCACPVYKHVPYHLARDKYCEEEPTCTPNKFLIVCDMKVDGCIEKGYGKPGDKIIRCAMCHADCCDQCYSKLC